MPLIELEDGAIWGGKQKGTDFERAPWLHFYGSLGDLSFQGRFGKRKKGNPTVGMNPIMEIKGLT